MLNYRMTDRLNFVSILVLKKHLHVFSIDAKSIICFIFYSFGQRNDICVCDEKVFKVLDIHLVRIWVIIINFIYSIANI